jgi:antitoxin component YwqK of YwqJK toxin-antitoxin module
MINKVLHISTVGFALVLGFLSAGCHSTDKNSYSIKNGVYYNNATGKTYNGFLIEKMYNNTVQIQITNGIKQGWFKAFNANNKMIIKGWLVKNKNEGNWTYYYPDGTVESEGNFLNDLPDGVWKWYYDNGKVKEVCRFVMGKRMGDGLLYNEDGKLVDKNTFLKGKDLKTKNI